MGCNISKIHGPEVVLRCRTRKCMIRDAFKYRKEFSLAHLAYIQVLLDVGGALYKFSDRQLSDLEISPFNYDHSHTVFQTSSVGYAMPSKLPILPSSSSSFPTSPPSLVPIQPPVHIDSSIDDTKLRKENKSPKDKSVSSTKPPDKLLSPLNKSPKLDSIQAHQKRTVSPLRRFDSSSPKLFPPARGLSGDSMNPSWSSMYSSPSVSASPQSSIWDPFNIFSPMPSRTQEQLLMEVQRWELDHQVELAREEGMPELEEENDLDIKMQQLEINKLEKNHANEVKTTIIDSFHEKIEVKPEFVKTDEDKDNNKKKGVQITDAIPMEGNGARKESPDGIREKIKLLPELIKKLNGVFIAVSECGNEVSEMLEIQPIDQQRSTFYSNESFRLASTIMRHWPHKVPLQREGLEEGADTVALDPLVRSHSLTLETLYTWEKKLYKEVKVWERLRVAYVRKCKQFNVFEHERRDADLIEETRAAMEGLNSRLSVAFDGITSTSASIELVTNKELYPQLVEFLRRLKNMWKAMRQLHIAQKTIALQLRASGKLEVKFKASDTHINATIQLKHELGKWHEGLSIWLKSQQKYISFLLDWIRVCHMEPDINVKAGVSLSPIVKTSKTPIYVLARSWHDSLIWLSKYLEASNAINQFSEALYALQLSEIEELKREEMPKTNSDHRSLSFRYMEKRIRVAEDGNILESEDPVFSILEKHLLAVFEMLSSFSLIAFEEYEKLYKFAESSVQIQNFSSRAPC